MTLQEQLRQGNTRLLADRILMQEAADRIDALEAEVRDLRTSVAAIPDHKGRIDALESALRAILTTDDEGAEHAYQNGDLVLNDHEESAL